MIPFSQFPNLEELKWTSFKGVEETTDLSALIHLRNISITGHPSLRKIEGFHALHALETVDLSRCSKLNSIEGLGTSIKLRQIELQGCRSLVRLPPLFQLEDLEELGLSHCSKLKRLDCIYLHPRLVTQHQSLSCSRAIAPSASQDQSQHPTSILHTPASTNRYIQSGWRGAKRSLKRNPCRKQQCFIFTALAQLQQSDGDYRA